MRQHSEQKGFTLIEIVIAMALFSLFLIATLGSLGALSKIFQHGIATRRAVDNSRLLIEDVARVARFASDASVTGSSSLPAIPAVSPAPNVTCGPNLNLSTPTMTNQYQFELSSQDFTGSNYTTANYQMAFNNNVLPVSVRNSLVTVNDGTSIDISKKNSNGIDTATYPGGYVFCLYDNPPDTYVKISFTINNSTTIKGPFLYFNAGSTGVNQGIDFTTTIGIGGAGQ